MFQLRDTSHSTCTYDRTVDAKLSTNPCYFYFLQIEWNAVVHGMDIRCSCSCYSQKKKTNKHFTRFLSDDYAILLMLLQAKGATQKCFLNEWRESSNKVSFQSQNLWWITKRKKQFTSIFGLYTIKMMNFSANKMVK